MEKKEYLNEASYQRTKNKISKIAKIVLVVGLLIGCALIATGIIKQNISNNPTRKEEQKASVQAQLETEKQILINSKTELEAKIKPVQDEIKKLKREPFNGFDDAYYEREDRIEELEKSILSDQKTISLIEKAMDESFSYYKFEEYKNNPLTAKYCSLRQELNGLNSELGEALNSGKYVLFYIFGAFVIFITCAISGIIFTISKRREIMAFSVQQVMPVAQEGIEKMAPTAGKVAKEIAKGIKEGLNSDED